MITETDLTGISGTDISFIDIRTSILFTELDLCKNLFEYTGAIERFLSDEYKARRLLPKDDVDSVYERRRLNSPTKMERYQYFPRYGQEDKGLLRLGQRHSGFLARVELKEFEISNQLLFENEEEIESVLYKPILTFYKTGILALRIRYRVPQNIAGKFVRRLNLNNINYKTPITPPYDEIKASVIGKPIKAMSGFFLRMLQIITEDLSDYIGNVEYSKYQLRNTVTVVEYSEAFNEDNLIKSFKGIRNLTELFEGSRILVTDHNRLIYQVDRNGVGSVRSFRLNHTELNSFVFNSVEFVHSSGYAIDILKQRIPSISERIITSKRLASKYRKQTDFNLLEADYIKLKLFIDSVLPTSDYLSKIKEFEAIDTKLENVGKYISSFDKIIERSIAEKTYKYTKSLNAIMLLLTIAATVLGVFTVLDYFK